jgi:predicted amidohydrolase YtcJ
MQADVVLLGGKVWTGTARPATAAALRDGRILALGDDSAMRDLLALGGEAISLGGRRVLPGLVDAHVHLEWFARSLREVDLSDARSEEEAAARVRERAAITPPGEWILGRGWAQSRWPGEVFPTAASLDAAAPDHPVCLNAYSGHALWVNSAVLALAGITAETPAPTSGQILRDESGRPTGVLTEDAMELVTQFQPETSPEELADRIEQAIAVAHRGGLTGIHDFDGANCFQALQILRDRGTLTLRVVKNIPIALLDHAIAVGLRWGFGDDMLRIGGVKSFADGALGVRTALMVEPYETDPTNTGVRVTSPEVMLENVRKASRAGLPSAIHGIGDRAVREILDVYEKVRKEEAARGVRMRHRIEHVQLIHPDDAHRLGELGIVASMQPTHATSDMNMVDTHWGDRADWSYAWRVQLRHGAVLAFGSDAPIESIEPLRGIHAAVTRRRPDGSPGPEGWRAKNEARLTVEEAVRGFTEGPAYAAGTENRLGKLAPGYLADLVVLDRDIFEIEPMAILAAGVAGTMVGGQWVHRTF